MPPMTINEPMPNLPVLSIDPKRTRMRQLVAAVDAGLVRWAGAGGGMDASSVCAEFRELVELMRLGPEPGVRACPRCGAVGMLLATRCGSCWSSLTPPVDSR